MKRTRLQNYGSGSNRARAFTVKFEKMGNWEKTVTKLASLDRNIKNSIVWGERKIADKILKLVRGHLRKQDLGWDPLSTSTLWKKDGDIRILIDTGTYLNNIKSWQAGGTRYVGVQKSVTEPKSGAEVWRVAQIHEFRSYNGGPYRALWGPSYEELGGAKGARAIMYDILYKKLLMLGYPVKKI